LFVCLFVSIPLPVFSWQKIFFSCRLLKSLSHLFRLLCMQGDLPLPSAAVSDLLQELRLQPVPSKIMAFNTLGFPAQAGGTGRRVFFL
jgi:hypothetical protein